MIKPLNGLDHSVEHCLSEIISMSHFAQLGLKEIANETTTLSFRHIRVNDFFEFNNTQLSEEELLMKTKAGTVRSLNRTPKFRQ